MEHLRLSRRQNVYHGIKSQKRLTHNAIRNTSKTTTKMKKSCIFNLRTLNYQVDILILKRFIEMN